jgi:hypothetical protein
MHERLECREFTPRESSATKLGLHCGECAALLCNKVDSKVSLAQRKTLAQLIRELIETPHMIVVSLQNQLAQLFKQVALVLLSQVTHSCQPNIKWGFISFERLENAIPEMLLEIHATRKRRHHANTCSHRGAKKTVQKQRSQGKKGQTMRF